MKSNRDKEKEKEKESKKPSELAAESNPCSKCRPFKVPVCPGHGGSGGGKGTSGSGKDKEATPSNASAQTSTNLSLESNPALSVKKEAEAEWTQPLAQDGKFNYEKESALLSVHLDLEKGTLILRGRADLSINDDKALQQYFSALTQELQDFCKEKGLVPGKDFSIDNNPDTNTLTIRFSNKENLQAFVNRLMDKNLLPTPSKELAQALKPTPANTSKRVEEDEAVETSKLKSGIPSPRDTPFNTNLTKK